MYAWLVIHFAWISEISGQELAGVDHPAEMIVEMFIAWIAGHR